jgi:hypothetical protein
VRTLVFLFLVSVSATAQNVKDTFLIIVPEDYKIEQDVDDAFIKWNKYNNDTLSSHYVLFYYTSSYHHPAYNRELFGLITNNESEPIIVDRNLIKRHKTRELKHYYSLLNANDYFSIRSNKTPFANKFIRGELFFYVIKEQDYLNENNETINLYTCDYLPAIIIE